MTGRGSPGADLHVGSASDAGLRRDIKLETANSKLRIVSSSANNENAVWIQSGTTWQSGSAASINFTGSDGSPFMMKIEPTKVTAKDFCIDGVGGKCLSETANVKYVKTSCTGTASCVAACPSGYVVIGGGFHSLDGHATNGAVSSWPVNNTWQVYNQYDSYPNERWDTYAVCMNAVTNL